MGMRAAVLDAITAAAGPGVRAKSVGRKSWLAEGILNSSAELEQLTAGRTRAADRAALLVLVEKCARGEVKRREWEDWQGAPSRSYCAPYPHPKPGCNPHRSHLLMSAYTSYSHSSSA